MDTDLFANGRDPSTYVSGLRNYRSFVRALADEAAAYLPRNGAEYVDRLAAAAAGPTAPLRATRPASGTGTTTERPSETT